MEAKKEAYWWWFDSHNTPTYYSPWLRSTLADLDEKAKSMLKLIEEDADSFAQRAEMYYKKRPELISMVEHFYRAYRSLAERYDQHNIRVKSPLRHSFPDFKSEFTTFNTSSSDEDYDSDHSEVDDPEEEEDNTHDAVVITDSDYECGNFDEMSKKLREEQMEILREENEKQRNLIKESEEETERMKKDMKEMQAQNTYLQKMIVEKDEEKREVIRQLSLAMEIMREENRVLKKSIAKDTHKIFKGFGNLFGLR